MVKSHLHGASCQAADCFVQSGTALQGRKAFRGKACWEPTFGRFRKQGLYKVILLLLLYDGMSAGTEAFI